MQTWSSNCQIIWLEITLKTALRKILAVLFVQSCSILLCCMALCTNCKSLVNLQTFVSRSSWWLNIMAMMMPLRVAGKTLVWEGMKSAWNLASNAFSALSMQKCFLSCHFILSPRDRLLYQIYIQRMINEYVKKQENKFHTQNIRNNMWLTYIKAEP